MEATREKRQIEIIQAALRVFGENGFFQGKMEEVAREAGIGKATIYEYFSSKSQLFKQMLLYYIEEYIKGGKEVISAEITFRERLIALANYNNTFISSQSKTLLQLVSQPSNVTEDIMTCILEIKAMVYRFIHEQVQYGVQTGELPLDTDLEIATLLIIGAMNTTSTRNLIADKTLNLAPLDSAKVVDMLLYGLSN